MHGISRCAPTLASRLALFFGLACLALASAPAAAQTPSCNKLPAGSKAKAAKLLASLHPYDCCDETIARCLKKKRVCRLAYRLAENICRRVAARQPPQKIKRALSRRARSMLSRRRATISLAGAPAIGAPKAPVTLVTYACARCPFCAKITPVLEKEVKSGRLKGKVRLVFKPFPIRGHKHSKAANLGFMAAARMGKFWPFMRQIYARFDKYCPKKQEGWAAAAGLDRSRFARLVRDPKTRKMLVASKKEGLRNKVGATPTFFIDGRLFAGELSVGELVDVLGEEHDRRKGLRYR